MNPYRSCGYYLFVAGLALLLAGTARADFSATVLSNSPVGYWRLNETAAVPAPNTATNLGSAGPAGNGYAVLDVTNGLPGVEGTCFAFSNPTQNLDYCGSKVDVPYNVALNPAGAFSVEFWANPASTNSDIGGLCPLCSINPDTTVDPDNRSGWLFYARGAPNMWTFLLGSQHNSYVGSAAGGNWSVGAWSHVVGVYDGANNLSLYVNGVLVAGPLSLSAPFEPNRFRNLRLGGGNFSGILGGPSGNRGWDGRIDEVAVYASALSGTTISNHYYIALSSPGNYPAQVLASSPVGYWQLNEPVYTPPAASSLPLAFNSGTAGAALNGTYFPGVTAGLAGAPFSGLGAGDHAINLTGVAGYISISNAPEVNFQGQITILAWIKPYQVDASPVLRDIVAHGYDDDHAIFLRINGGLYEIGSWDGTTIYSASWPMPPGDVGNWVFLAGTYDGASWNLYRYDKLVATSPSATGALTVNADWSIGSRGDPGAVNAGVDGRFFGGGVDEVALFTNALSAAQLRAIFYAANVSPLRIQFGPGAAQITLTWGAGILQQATQFTGPFTDFTDVPGANSPYVISGASGTRFYRTR